MKQFTGYKTCNGQLFKHKKDAVRHADKRYSALLHQIAIALSDPMIKYTDRMEWLDVNANLLKELLELRHDLHTFENEED